MDVVCGRCRAEYEFDDALISERGTTVRCTNCGLQFKVFPPVGQRAPEVWRVYESADRQTPPVEYPSLRELQKAIARGDVRGEHLLSRGGDEPRPLGEIVELQPLLQQPRSEPPPPMPAGSEVQVPASPPTGLAPSSTVMGVAQRPDPAAIQASRMAPAPPAVRADGEDSLPDAPAPPAASGDAQESKPKIRSALSMNPPVEGQASSTARGDSEPPSSQSPSLAPPRQSLRSTLSGSFPTPSQAGVPPSQSRVDRDSADRDAGEHSAIEQGIIEPSPPAEAAAPPTEERASTPPAVEPRPEPSASAQPGGPTDDPVAGPKSSADTASAAITPPVEPEITDSGEFPGQMTPTPSGMRAYRHADSEPASSIAGVPVKRGARSGGIVFAVLVGAVAFLGFANRDRISAMFAGADPAAMPEGDVEASEVSDDLVLRLEMADVAWVSENLLETAESEFGGGPRSTDLQTIERELAQAGAAKSWHMVNLKRASGRFDEARSLAGQLNEGAEQPYALALLDLAEGGDKPPWPVILERLKEASTGERGRFLARTVYVYALASSGEVARAKADFDALSQIAGAKESPLYEELKVFVGALGEDADSEEPESETDETETDESETDEAETEVADGDPEDSEKTEAEPEPQPDPTKPEEKPAPAPSPKPAQVSAAIKAKVEQADAMWRGGNQDGALAIYRQVVAEIGTKNFLGQRSAARIRQAQRERSGTQ